MKFKIISVCILLVVISLSCKKDEMYIAGNPELMFLSNVLLDDQPYCLYVYNDSNLVNEESSKFDFTLNHYNDKNQLVSSDYYWNNVILNTDIKMVETTLSQGEFITSANGTKGRTVRYEYNSTDLLTKATYTGPNGGSEYSAFSYDSNSRIDRQTIYWNDTETGYIDYSYDEKGNLIKEILYNLSATGLAEPSTTIRYAFDNKQNPYKLFRNLMIPGINTNRNNITKETYIMHRKADQGTEKIQITENSYEYNVNGYPVSKNGNIEYVYE